MCIDNADSAQREIKMIPRAKALKAYRWFDYYYAAGDDVRLEALFHNFVFKRGPNRTDNDPAEDPNRGFHSLKTLQATKDYEWVGDVIAQVLIWGTVAIECDDQGTVLGYRSTHLEVVKAVYFDVGRTQPSEKRQIRQRYERKAA